MLKCSVLGEYSFMSIADLDTPSGYSSVLDPSGIAVTVAGASDMTDGARAAFGSDMLSSTMREDVSSSALQCNISAIQEVFFCTKCGDIFQT